MDGLALRRFVPWLLIEPAHNVLRLELPDLKIAAPFAESLGVKAVTAVRLRRLALFRPAQKVFADGSDPRVHGFCRL